MERQLIDKFAGGGKELRIAFRGLTRDDLLATPGPGVWSIQELVVHLADSDAIAIDRMKRVIAEDNPTLLYADESAYVRELCCGSQSVEDAVVLFEVGRRQFARVLVSLPAVSFARAGVHSTRGPVTLEQMVVDYTEHLEHHLRFLYAKRERLGKPISFRIPSAAPQLIINEPRHGSE
jgi:DinB superfamily